MARVPYLSKDDLAPEDRVLLDRDIALNRVLAHTPGGARAFSRLGGYIRSQSSLDARVRELAILQVGYASRSPYEFSHHIKIGYDFGVTDDDIRALIADTEGRETGLPALDRAVLRAAREMASDGSASAGTVAELAAHLSNEHLLDLVITIAFYCGVVRLLATLDVDVEPEYQAYLERFPLPPA
ncbi:MAG TPA: carboxymuconolactone decarboxylase family protein [Tepidiformaceae bacterium]|nr:carboxymuconolactone decarboxylase family protein [Tepidiformaceae bacterium]